MKVKLAGRPALVQLAPSRQLITAHAGLVLVRELASRLGLAGLLDRVTVKERRRGYSPAQAILALCETLIAGGECLDDVALLRGDRAQELLRGHGLPDPTTLGRFLRRFTLGHLGQLNRALDQLFGFVGETGEWLHAKLRSGHAAASTGAKCFLVECLRRLPAGASVFLRADEGFFGQGFLAELERRQITYAIGAPLLASVRTRISEVAEAEWHSSSYRPGSEVCSFSWRPKSWKQARRFVVRRDPVEPGEQLSLEGREWHYWALVTNDPGRSADELERWQRAKANVENRIKEAKLGFALDNLPSQRFHANWAYLLCTLLAYDLLVWLKLLALPASEQASYAKRLRFRFVAVAASVGRSGRRLVLRLQSGYPLYADFCRALTRLRALARAPA